MSWALALLVVTAIVAPHKLSLRTASPMVGATLWGCALALRALVVLATAVWMVIYLPTTDLFAAVAQQCWHTVVPLLTTHLSVTGHRVGDLASVAPSLLVLASLVWVLTTVVRAARGVGRWVDRMRLGRGPLDSVIVGAPGVVVAAAGIRRPRLIVSPDALTALDDAELAAGLEHERGHIARHHRYVTMLAEICGGLARPLPGTRHATRELAFHLERDADRWAIDHSHDRLALASAICKAAISQRETSSAFAALGGRGSVSARIEGIVDDVPLGSPLRRWMLRTIAVMSAVTVMALTAAVPVMAVSHPHAAETTHVPCPH